MDSSPPKAFARRHGLPEPSFGRFSRLRSEPSWGRKRALASCSVRSDDLPHSSFWPPLYLLVGFLLLPSANTRFRGEMSDCTRLQWVGLPVKQRGCSGWGVEFHVKSPCFYSQGNLFDHCFWSINHPKTNRLPVPSLCTFIATSRGHPKWVLCLQCFQDIGHLTDRHTVFYLDPSTDWSTVTRSGLVVPTTAVSVSQILVTTCCPNILEVHSVIVPDWGNPPTCP